MRLKFRDCVVVVVVVLVALAVPVVVFVGDVAGGANVVT